MARSASTERSWESTSAARSAMPPVMYASRACWASRPSVRLISVCTSASEAAAWRRFSRAVASRLRACSRRASARETSSLALVSAIDRALASARASRSTPSMLLSWSWVRERSSCSSSAMARSGTNDVAAAKVASTASRVRARRDKGASLGGGSHCCRFARERRMSMGDHDPPTCPRRKSTAHNLGVSEGAPWPLSVPADRDERSRLLGPWSTPGWWTPPGRGPNSSCSPTTPRPWTCARSPATGTTSWAPCSLSRPGSTSTAATPKWSCASTRPTPSASSRTATPTPSATSTSQTAGRRSPLRPGRIAEAAALERELSVAGSLPQAAGRLVESWPDEPADHDCRRNAGTRELQCRGGTLQLSPAGEGVVDQQYPAPVEAGGHLEGVVAGRKVPCRSSTCNQQLFVVAGHARHHADGPHEWMTTRTAFARRHGRDRFPMADALAVLVDESREQRRDSRKKSRPEFLGTVLVAAEEVVDVHQGGSVQAELHRRIEELVDGFDDGGARPLRISLRPLLLQDERAQEEQAFAVVQTQPGLEARATLAAGLHHHRAERDPAGHDVSHGNVTRVGGASGQNWETSAPCWRTRVARSWFAGGYSRRRSPTPPIPGSARRSVRPHPIRPRRRD